MREMTRNAITIDDIPSEVSRLKFALPKFSDGRIDYTNSEDAPVMNIYAIYDNKLLLVKRSEKVGWLKNRWHVMAGFLDEEKPLREKVLEELSEEVGVSLDAISSMRVIDHRSVGREKTWIIYSIEIGFITQPSIRLDWEHTGHVWVKKDELSKYELTPEVYRVANLLLQE
jgi:hypothetical protein